MSMIITTAILVFTTWLALQLGGAVPLLGTSISAIFLGSVIRHTPIFEKLDKQVVGFVTKYLLKGGIVLLGFTLSFRIITDVGLGVLAVLAAEVIASISIAFLLKDKVHMSKNLSLLLGIGTSICGGAAIVSTSPILEAEDDEVAVAITTMFVYSIVSLFVLPIIGRALGYSDQLYGILAGAAVNDTASVVATAFQWSDTAGQFGTVVKLVRTLFIVPVTVFFILHKIKEREAQAHASAEKESLSAKQVFDLVPRFVLLFISAVIIASVFTIPADITKQISTFSKLLMTIGLVTIGLGVHVKQIVKAGFKPIFLGGICWITVATVSILMITIIY